MQRAGHDQTPHAMAARGLIEVAQAHDIGRQNTLKAALFGHAAHVHHGIHARQQLVHGLRVFQTGGDTLFARSGRAYICRIRNAQRLAVRCQACA